jgi:hypothetical protein
MEHRAASLNSYDNDGDNVVGGGSNTFQFNKDDGTAAASDAVGCLAYQSEHNHLILYAPNGNDIEVKDYDDPIRDLRGFNARIHCDQEYSQDRSAGVIQRA